MNVSEKDKKSLSSQEKKVLGLVAEAKSNKEIAATLDISPCTVKRHIENILRKLNLKNRTEAAVYAVKIGEFLSNFVGPEEGDERADGPSDQLTAKAVLS